MPENCSLDGTQATPPGSSEITLMVQPPTTPVCCCIGLKLAPVQAALAVVERMVSAGCVWLLGVQLKIVFVTQSRCWSKTGHACCVYVCVCVCACLCVCRSPVVTRLIALRYQGSRFPSLLLQKGPCQHFDPWPDEFVLVTSACVIALVSPSLTLRDCVWCSWFLARCVRVSAPMVMILV